MGIRRYLGYLFGGMPWRKKLKGLEWVLRHHKLWGPFPLYAKIEIDQRCNLNCEMCQRTKIVNNAYLSVDEFKEIIRKLGTGLLMVDIFGYGEPLMHPNYIEILSHLRDNGIMFNVITNGTLLDTPERRRALLELKPRRIKFSIDAGEKGIYERIRKGANFEQVRENFIELVRIRDELYPVGMYHRPQLDIYCTMTMQNLEQIPKMVEVKNEWGADYLTFSDLAWNNQFGTSTFENCVREMLTNSEIDDLMWPYEDRTDIMVHLKAEGHRTCDYPASHIYVDAEGWIYSCTCVPGFEKPFGNIFDIEDIKEVYQSDAYNEFREKSRLGMLDSKSCRRCLQWGPSLDKL